MERDDDGPKTLDVSHEKQIEYASGWKGTISKPQFNLW